MLVGSGCLDVRHHRSGEKVLPVLGQASWEPTGEVAERRIAAVKSLAESEKKVAIDQLAEVLVAPEVALDE